MKLEITVLSDLPGLSLTKIGSWYLIREPGESRWMHETHYRANHPRERLTAVDRNSPTAHRDEVRQWRARQGA